MGPQGEASRAPARPRRPTWLPAPEPEGAALPRPSRPVTLSAAGTALDYGGREPRPPPSPRASAGETRPRPFKAVSDVHMHTHTDTCTQTRTCTHVAVHTRMHTHTHTPPPCPGRPARSAAACPTAPATVLQPSQPRPGPRVWSCLCPPRARPLPWAAVQERPGVCTSDRSHPGWDHPPCSRPCAREDADSEPRPQNPDGRHRAGVPTAETPASHGGGARGQLGRRGPRGRRASEEPLQPAGAEEVAKPAQGASPGCGSQRTRAQQVPWERSPWGPRVVEQGQVLFPETGDALRWRRHGRPRNPLGHRGAGGVATRGSPWGWSGTRGAERRPPRGMRPSCPRRSGQSRVHPTRGAADRGGRRSWERGRKRQDAGAAATRGGEQAAAERVESERGRREPGREGPGKGGIDRQTAGRPGAH